MASRKQNANIQTQLLEVGSELRTDRVRQNMNVLVEVGMDDDLTH